MDNNKFRFTIDDREHEMEMVFVEGTKAGTFLFGTKNDQHRINIKDYVTKAKLRIPELFSLFVC